MADGRTEAIDQVKVGDKITNAAPDSATTQTDTVTAVHVTLTDHDFDQLTVATPGGPQSITTTAEHFFWDATTHSWEQADNVNVGDLLDTPNGGHATVVATRHYSGSLPTYDLTIDNIHTFYVAADSTAVLVHNCPKKREPDSAPSESRPGQATVHYHGTGNHFSIEVTDGDTTVHTHLYPYDRVPTIEPYRGDGIVSHTFELPNASAAMDFQAGEVDRGFPIDDEGNPRAYDQRDNSCLTHCTQVLNEGGIVAPTNGSAITWIRRILRPGDTRPHSADLVGYHNAEPMSASQGK